MYAGINPRDAAFAAHSLLSGDQLMASTLSDLRSISGTNARPIVTIPLPPFKWKTRFLIPGAVVLATLGVLAYAARHTFSPSIPVWVAAAVPKSTLIPASHNAPAADEAPAQPTDQPADTALGAVLVQAPGWIEPSPYPISVPALEEGVVRDVHVLEGDHVAKGQIVATLIDEDAKLQIRIAQAALAEREADVVRARAAVATAEVQVRIEQAAVAELADDIERSRELVPIGGISAGEFRRKEIRIGAYQARAAAAERSVDEARSALKQAEAGANTAMVAIEAAQLVADRMEVRSPSDGVVLIRLVEPGSRIMLSSKGDSGPQSPMTGAVIRIYNPKVLQVRVDVPLAEAAKVGIGTPCTITSEALPDTTFRGRVTRVMHEANIQRNTVQFKVSIDDPSPVLKPEMLARVKLHAPAPSGSSGASGASGVPTESNDLALLIPVSALSETSADAAAAWVVEWSSGAAIARRRQVQWAPAVEAGYAHIRTGITLTDRVILDPPSTLADGATVLVLGERVSALPNTTN